LVVSVVVTTLAAATVTVAAAGPFLPGSLLFPVQQLSEDGVERLLPFDAVRADYRLFLFGRRISDLARLAGSQAERAGLRRLEQALERATWALSLVRGQQSRPLQEEMIRLLLGAREAVARLSIAPAGDPDLLLRLEAKIDGLVAVLSDPEADLQALAQALPAEGNTPAGLIHDSPLPTIEPRDIPFPDDSVGAEHAFYVLLGKHADLTCQSCHAGAQYSETPSDCVGCHAGVLPDEHWLGDRASCHTPASW
jgi:hypothetical protein